MLTKRNIKAKLRDGRLTPGKSYAGMDIDQIASEYLKRCKDEGACAGCNNPLDDMDREINGDSTNECVSCSCS